MPTLKKFEDLDVWKVAIHLSKEIYLITQKEIFSNDISLRDQLRLTAISIPNNIAEGFEYNQNDEFINHLKKAKANCSTLRSMIILANKIEYMNDVEKENYDLLTMALSNKIGSLLKYLNDKNKEEFN